MRYTLDFKLAALTVALAAPLLTSPAAFGQSAASPAPTAGAPENTPAVSRGSSGASSPTAMQKTMSQQVERHIGEMHKNLEITAAEQPQWDQLVTVMRSNSADVIAAFDQRLAKVSTMTAAENMQSYADLSQIHADHMQKLATAFQSLYAVMSPSQKQNADRVFRASAQAHAATR